jgi:predicted protein tyrosine phosphatase
MAITLSSYKHEFINFREIQAGRIAPKWLYRSSHPVIHSETDFIMAKLAEEAEIAAVLNLDDNEIKLVTKADHVPWYHCLFKRGCIIALDMGFDCLSDQFSFKLQKGLKFMIDHNGPYLIHCMQGIDRTGFVVMILEMLMEANRNEMINDYMLSFLRRPGFEKGSKRYRIEKNNFVRVLNTIYTIGKKSEGDKFVDAAKNYLLKNTDLTHDEIHLLKLTLSKHKQSQQI